MGVSGASPGYHIINSYISLAGMLPHGHIQPLRQLHMQDSRNPDTGIQGSTSSLLCSMSGLMFPRSILIPKSLIFVISTEFQCRLRTPWVLGKLEGCSSILPGLGREWAVTPAALTMMRGDFRDLMAHLVMWTKQRGLSGWTPRPWVLVFAHCFCYLKPSPWFMPTFPLLAWA